MRPNLCAFISGHGDITEKEFDVFYKPQIDHAIDECHVDEFVVGDFRGADLMAQNYLAEHGVKVTVYHMFDKPRHNPHNYPTIGGFTDDESRDAAMTLASTRDIAWVRPGKEGSCTEKNINRREDEPCQLRKEPFFQCCCTCIYHRPVHYHCCTEPKPKVDEREFRGCHCGTQKRTNDGKELNWACVAPESDRVYDNWGEHSCGCELHTTKEEWKKWQDKKQEMLDFAYKHKPDTEFQTPKK